MKRRTWYTHTPVPLASAPVDGRSLEARWVELANEQLPEEELEPDDEINALQVEDGDGEAEEQWAGVAPPDRKLIAQPVDMAVSDLVAQISDGELHLNPVYQRRYVWDDRKASKLIESLLINVPIPVCYFAEEGDGTRSTIDGQQRLRSLRSSLRSTVSVTSNSRIDNNA